MKERRKYVRLALALNLSYLPAEERGAAYKTISKDISPIGIRITTEKELKVGQRLKLNIDIPNSPEPIEVNAKVAWTKSLSAADKPAFESGMRFISFPQEIHKDIFFKYIGDMFAQQKPNF